MLYTFYLSSSFFPIITLVNHVTSYRKLSVTWTDVACVAGGMCEPASGDSTLHQSSHGFATRVNGFATKTKALAREIPPATQATSMPKPLTSPFQTKYAIFLYRDRSGTILTFALKSEGFRTFAAEVEDFGNIFSAGLGWRFTSRVEDCCALRGRPSTKTGTIYAF